MSKIKALLYAALLAHPILTQELTYNKIGNSKRLLTNKQKKGRAKNKAAKKSRKINRKN